MTHRTRFGAIAILASAALFTLGAAGVTAGQPIVRPAPSEWVGDIEPTPIPPGTTDRELFCMLLKILGKPCPPEDFLSYEEYYAQIEAAWYACDPNGFSPERREDLLAAALDVRDSQTPAPPGVDPVAYGNFILVLDEIIYEMGA